jgi:hypothetical protein
LPKPLVAVALLGAAGAVMFGISQSMQASAEQIGGRVQAQDQPIEQDQAEPAAAHAAEVGTA